MALRPRGRAADAGGGAAATAPGGDGFRDAGRWLFSRLLLPISRAARRGALEKRSGDGGRGKKDAERGRRISSVCSWLVAVI